MGEPLRNLNEVFFFFFFFGLGLETGQAAEGWEIGKVWKGGGKGWGKGRNGGVKGEWGRQGEGG